MKYTFIPVGGSNSIFHIFIAILLMCASLGCDVSSESTDTKTMSVDDMITLPKIDSHAHIYPGLTDEQKEEDFIRMLDKHNLKWFNICTRIESRENLEKRVMTARQLHAKYPDRIYWATSFDLTDLGSPDWESNAIDFIGEGFDNGAVAVKVWKEIGMVLQDPDGSFVMIDDPRLKKILDFIESNNKTLVAHLGEPRNCWLPVEEMTVDGDRNYFKNNPQYHAYLHSEIPHYKKQIEARDHILEMHPNLRVVGCHLGSLEFDTDELAKRLDAYPNFAVDTAARIVHFKVQDREKVRQFIIKYQDRILYGTDIGLRNEGSFKDNFKRIQETYYKDYRYFATDEEIDFPSSGGKIRGLKLPPEVLKKIFYSNFFTWYPDLD